MVADPALITVLTAELKTEAKEAEGAVTGAVTRGEDLP
jgi:hypothetical protein